MKFDGFLVAMIVAVLLALKWPEVGAAAGPLHLGTVTAVGIAVVFFLHGVLLAPEAIRRGATKWQLHLFIQTSTFVIFPVLGGLLYWLTEGVLPDELRIGFFLLCAMSSTISSSVAMTTMAKGDVASAVFNASVSGLIGMLATPLLMQLVVHGEQGVLPLGNAIGGILVTLALPFAAGQLLRPLLLKRVLAWKPVVSKIDRAVIVLIVYSSFCESTASGVWHQFGVGQLLLTGGLSALLLAVMLAITHFSARAMGLVREEEITAIFCGSKKSLANGAPIARILFGAHPGFGMIMLPLMIYHQVQLFVCALLARRYARLAPGDAAR